MKRNPFTPMSAMPSILLLNTAIVLLGSLTGTIQVAAQELFVLSTDKGMEFYVVDGQLTIPPLVCNRTIGAPHFAYGSRSLPYTKLSLPFQAPSLHIAPFRDMRRQFLDPGFTTSLTGRVITIAGRIEWTTPGGDVPAAVSRSLSKKIPEEYSLASSRLSPLKAGHSDSRAPQ